MGYSKSVINRSNNDKGRYFEKLIEQGCIYYQSRKIAMIEKTPEPFQVLSINKQKKTFTGFFKSKAQPDFKGTLRNGRAIVFEAKRTDSKRIEQKVITANQSNCLDMHYELGAYCGVCCMVNKTVAFVPWNVWKNMKEIYGRKYMNEEELSAYQVPTPMFADFLHHWLKDIYLSK